MKNILGVKKKIEKSYLIWFQNSNLYFSLEEPAWYVFRKTVKRYKSETIAKEFTDRYGLNFEESLKFVTEIRQKIYEMNQSVKPASQKTILFSAAPGSGKSTIAALLQTKGYKIISDDFVPIERSTFKAYPFPIAMSVKEGSLDLLKPHYPELEHNPLITLTPEKRIKYLPIDNKIMKMVFPAKEFIFIKYDNSVDFSMEKIEPANAVKTLFEEAWIPPQPENVEVFLDKILNISFYRLTYSNNNKALEAISQLFGNN